jgi:hypothetical protein
MLDTPDRSRLLDREFLEIRARILDLAAALDRLDRAPDPPGPPHHPDARLGQIRQALEVLLSPDADRTETVQQVFSLEYAPDWRHGFHLSDPRF